MLGEVQGIATFSDDDLTDVNIFDSESYGCDDLYAGPAGSLRPPDLTSLELRYSPAYVLPVHDMKASAVQGLPTFIRNQDFGSGRALWDQARAARNRPVSTLQFWTVMVISAWQAEESEDGDPAAEGRTGGISTHEAGETTGQLGYSYTGICAVFKAIKQAEAGKSNIAEGFTVAHEIAHTLGLPHNDPDDGEPPPVPLGLMDEVGPGQNPPFRPESLKKIREYSGP